MKKLLLALLLLFPVAAQATISASTVWEVRATNGTDTNGGAFVYGTSGTDFSQQNAKNTTGSNISTTDAVAAGTTMITSTTASFTSAVTGNIIYLAGGTGSLTAGWYQATYVSATSITVDRAVATGTGITMNIGGALKSISQVCANVAGNNYIYAKAEATYSIPTTVTCGQALKFFGYTSTRGDNGKITFQATAASLNPMLTFSIQYTAVYNVIVDCNSQPTCSGIKLNQGNSILQNFILKNFTVYGAQTVNGSGISQFILGEVTSGVSGCTGGIYAAGSVVQNVNFHDTACSGVVGISSTETQNLFTNISGATSDAIQDGGGLSAFNNTCYNPGRNCVYITGNNLDVVIKNNLFANAGAYGINTSGTLYPASPQYDGNAYYGNVSGARHNFNDTSGLNGIGVYTNVYDVNLTSSPFVNAASGNYALNSIAGGGASATGTGQPATWPNLSTTTAHPAFGAVQPQSSTGGGSYVLGN